MTYLHRDKSKLFCIKRRLSNQFIFIKNILDKTKLLIKYSTYFWLIGRIKFYLFPILDFIHPIIWYINCKWDHNSSIHKYVSKKKLYTKMWKVTKNEITNEWQRSEIEKTIASHSIITVTPNFRIQLILKNISYF